MSDQDKSTKRRSVLAVLGLTGAAAATLAVLPGRRTAQDASDTAAQTKSKPQRGGGYALTEHVKRYFETTRI